MRLIHLFLTDSSIAIDKDNRVHISYDDCDGSFDCKKFMVKYATNKSGAWGKETIDNIGDVGRYNAMAIDQNGFVHICYTDAWFYDSNYGLKYATNKSGKWETYIIDNVKVWK